MMNALRLEKAESCLCVGSGLVKKTYYAVGPHYFRRISLWSGGFINLTILELLLLAFFPSCRSLCHVPVLFLQTEREKILKWRNRMKHG